MLFEDFLKLGNEDRVFFCMTNRKFDNQIFNYLIENNDKNLEECLSYSSALTENFELLEKLSKHENKQVRRDCICNSIMTLELLKEMQEQKDLDKNEDWDILGMLKHNIELKEQSQRSLYYSAKKQT